MASLSKFLLKNPKFISTYKYNVKWRWISINNIVGIYRRTYTTHIIQKIGHVNVYKVQTTSPHIIYYFSDPFAFWEFSVELKKLLNWLDLGWYNLKKKYKLKLNEKN
jgi:hypothetical protein